VHLVDDGEENVAVFLSEEQRNRLIAAAPKALAVLLTGYMHTGARPSELANATVADFDPGGGNVVLRSRKGRGSKIRARAVTLSNEGIQFFKAQAKRCDNGEITRAAQTVGRPVLTARSSQAPT
jgi:integrase